VPLPPATMRQAVPPLDLAGNEEGFCSILCLPMRNQTDHFQWNRTWLRWLGHAWASPNTLLGVFLGLLGSAKWQRVEHTVEVLLKSGPVLGTCRRLGISAFTLGDCVLYATEPCENLRVHEGQHSRQYWLLGPFFLPSYFALLALKGYWDHPLERDARRREQEKCGCLYGGQLAPPE
jgi:hypothetical protein